MYFSPKNHERIATLDGLWERTITVGSGGKTFGTTGWRVGWLIGPKALVEPALAAQTRIVFCVNSPLQEAIAIGFEQADERGFFGSQVDAYEHKREKLLSVFRELGLPCTIPEGSYFILVNTDKIQVPKDFVFPELLHSRPKDFRTCYWLTKEIGVCAIPPTEFYSKPNQILAENFARFAFCKTDETLDAAAERLLKLKPYIR